MFHLQMIVWCLVYVSVRAVLSFVDVAETMARQLGYPAYLTVRRVLRFATHAAHNNIVASRERREPVAAEEPEGEERWSQLAEALHYEE